MKLKGSMHMFTASKPLIVVYKDEMILNQLKKLVESKDDTSEKIVGSKDGSINIVAWTEKVWLANKKPGNIQGKILFINDIKGTDKLIPVLDVKFNEYGIRYGWAGNQAILYVNSKELIERSSYLNFISELSKLPIPEMYKQPKNTKIKVIDENREDLQSEQQDNDCKNLFLKAKEQLAKGVNQIEKAGIKVAMNAEDYLRDKNYLVTQMLFYGIVHLYNDGLDEFMNM